MNKKFFAILSAFLLLGSFFAFAAPSAETEDENSEKVEAIQQDENAVEEAKAEEKAPAQEKHPLRYLAAALAVAIACIGGGSAVSKIGSAAMGAMSENPELSGKALPFVGLAEGICLWGFLVALFIIIM